VMDIILLLYGLTVIPVAGVILSVVMLIKDFRGYRKSVLKKVLITALIALLLLGISLLPGQSEAFAGFYIVGLPLTILGPGGGFGWDLWLLTTCLVWLNWFGICCFFTIGVKLLCGIKENK
ncbi:MAG: hypothetical protein IKB16_08970, partial [Lentisphaeria bacterium]|nr:hypothetical protein [Lentisphaeria bacterium]